MDVSLEEIIKRKKTTRKGKFQPRFKPTKSPQKNGGIKAKPKLKVGDARMKIIQQNRTKLVDARDKLVQMAKQTDARLKLQKIRKQNVNAQPLVKRRQNVGNTRFTLSTNQSGQISLSSKKDLSRRPAQLQRSIKNDFQPRGLLPMHRTIVNDEITPLSRMPPLPDIAPVWDADLYRTIAPVRKPEPVIPRDLNMRITVKQNPVPISRDIISDDDGDFPMMSPRMSYPPTRKRPARALSPEPEHSSVHRTRGYSSTSPIKPGYYPLVSRPRMRTNTIDLTESIHSRLDVSPTPVRSMGILASGGSGSRGSLISASSRSRTQQSQSAQEFNSPQGYRIVVSNLQSNVTQEDIKELFEDVGELLESRLVRPGTAEVIFKSLSDAQRAVDVYHNRQLDGQPMKCLLVNPRLGNRPTAPALRPASSHLRTQHGSTRKTSSGPRSSIEPDIDTFHSVMFKRR